MFKRLVDEAEQELLRALCGVVVGPPLREVQFTAEVFAETRKRLMWLMLARWSVRDPER